ncbi:TIGR02265 family protein [Myxococcus hansupus]|uniref:TIGR02265 family protein n=1 Tax=Pseudomyxococcus hansupus TaxID=1297742 RepID=UPI000272958C|nr:TIGR02265 family protein [Myxococcus hansupus]
MEKPEPLVFQQSFQGLIRALGDDLDDTCAGRLRDAGLDTRGSLALAYPLEVWVAALKVAAATLAPESPLDEAAAVVGKRFVEGFSSTLIGNALLGTVRLLGPQRMLARMTRNLRTGTNYLETHMEQLGPTRYALTCRPVVVAGFYVGLFLAGLEASGARNPAVQIVRREGEEAVYDIAWG